MVVEDLKLAYLKTKTCLEESWEEIGLLEKIIAEQEHEIASLRAQLGRSTSIASTSCSSDTVSSRDSDQSQQSFNTLSLPTVESLTQKAKEVDMADRQLLIDGLSFNLTNQGGSHSSRNLFTIKEIPDVHKQLLMRDKRVVDLEKKLKQSNLRYKLQSAEMEHAIEKLRLENQHREKKLVDLQSQVAEYMLKELKRNNLREMCKTKKDTFLEVI